MKVKQEHSKSEIQGRCKAPSNNSKFACLTELFLLLEKKMSKKELKSRT